MFSLQKIHRTNPESAPIREILFLFQPTRKKSNIFLPMTRSVKSNWPMRYQYFHFLNLNICNMAANLLETFVGCGEALYCSYCDKWIWWRPWFYFKFNQSTCIRFWRNKLNFGLKVTNCWTRRWMIDESANSLFLDKKNDNKISDEPSG